MGLKDSQSLSSLWLRLEEWHKKKATLSRPGAGWKARIPETAIIDGPGAGEQTT